MSNPIPRPEDPLRLSPSVSESLPDSSGGVRDGVERGPSPLELARVATLSFGQEDMRSPESGSIDAIGAVEPLLPPPDVDVVLVPSRTRPIAGELWSVIGEVHNRSKGTVWIVHTRTILTLAPEMWGQTSEAGSLPAFFPTTTITTPTATPTRPADEVLRMDPGAKYTVVWKISTIAEDANSLRQVFRRIWCALRDFTFFNPGVFTISSTVHVWSRPPRIERGLVTNVGESYPISVNREIEMEASPWVLIVGAAMGGILCFVIQVAFQIIKLQGQTFDMFKTVALGLGTATLLCGIATVLISRLAKADFIIVVKVNDVWGAITTGFIIQWFGYDALAALVPIIGQSAP